jgi:hypothetical protein
MGKTTGALSQRELDSAIEASTDTPASLVVHEETSSDAPLVTTSVSDVAEAEDIAEIAAMEEEPLDADDPESLRAQIEQTRSEMSETIEAIKTKLDPHVLMEEAVDKAKDTAHNVAAEARNRVKKVGTRAVGIAKRNPVPVALGGAVLGWVLLRAWNKRRHRNVIVCD